MVVLSGGNVDSLLLVKLIDYGLSASGRFLRISARVPGPSGRLAELTKVIAEQDVNVLDVEHHREGAGVGVDEVEVDFTLETHDWAHGDQVLAAMRAEGRHRRGRPVGKLPARERGCMVRPPVRNPVTYRL